MRVTHELPQIQHINFAVLDKEFPSPPSGLCSSQKVHLLRQEPQKRLQASSEEPNEETTVYIKLLEPLPLFTPPPFRQKMKKLIPVSPY